MANETSNLSLETLWRLSPEGHAWAKKIVFPGVSREQQAVPDHA
jgi:hypothetical protein